MRVISLEVILRVVFGIFDERRRDAMRDAIVSALTAPSMPPVGPLYPLFRKLPPYRHYPGKLARVHGLLDEEIAERRRDPDLEQRSDVLSTLICARFEDGSQMDDRELRDQLEALLLAGHESIASTLAWCFDLLLHEPPALERLTADLEADGSDYLEAVIDETLRLRPPALVTPRRLGEATELSGYRLEADTTVLVSMYLANTHADVYAEPLAFRPERFLDAKPETYSWIPFGGGTRRCIGAAFAQFEMRAVVRAVLEAVTLVPGRDEPDTPMLPTITIQPKHGAQAIVSART
jgi:cytochrome P450